MGSPNIIGIGAVNLDYIIDSRAIERSASNSVDIDIDIDINVGTPASFDGFDYGSERSATAEEIAAALLRFEPLNPVLSPGGSSLNTLATIAASGAPVSLGYVGVRGNAPVAGFSFPDWFSSLNIDDRFVAPADDVTGICLSYTDGGQRSMLTTDGANRFIMNHIEDNADELLTYLCGAEVVLVTSFANLTDIAPLVDLIGGLKRSAPDVTICVDPGALWSIGAVPTGIDRLMTLADWVLVNRQEFEAFVGGESDRRGTDRSGDQRVLVKGAERIEIYSGFSSTAGPGRDHRTLPNPNVLAPDDIVDDTGAGDAFAAGFLTSLIVPELDKAEGVDLGFRLAGEKLRWPGLSGMHRYREIYDRFQRERQSGS